MQLTEFQISAIVDTLEKEHNKFWREKDKLTEKPPVEKKDKDGLTVKERAFLVAKNKRIRKSLSKLPLETRIELQYQGSDFFTNYHGRTEKGALESEKFTLDNLIEAYNDGKEQRKWQAERKRQGQPKKETGRTFNRAEATRRVTLASIDCNSIQEILAKVRKREVNKEVLEKARRAVPKKKAAKKK